MFLTNIFDALAKNIVIEFIKNIFQINNKICHLTSIIIYKNFMKMIIEKLRRQNK